MSFNLTNIANNASDIGQLVVGVSNELTGGWAGPIFLMGLAAVMAMAFFQQTGDWSRSILATSVISFGLTMLLVAIGLMPEKGLIICLIASALGVAFTWKK